MLLYFIRHGQTESNTKDIAGGHHESPLTETGKEQAKKVGEKCKSIPFDCMWTSTLSRAQDTAKAILEANVTDIHMQIDERLIERSYGIFEGKPNAELIKASLAHGFENQFLLFESGLEPSIETPEAIQNRFFAWFEENISQHEYEHVCIVTHAALIKNVFSKMLNIKTSEYIKHLPGIHNTAVSIVSFDKEKNTFSIVTLNDYSHLW